jgi:hypothetical protein
MTSSLALVWSVNRSKPPHSTELPELVCNCLPIWELSQGTVTALNKVATSFLARRSNIFFFFCERDPIYLQSVIIHSANGGKGEGWHVEEYSVALLC